ncbi:hypothetical protein FZEAL_3534 [Fusarium zealandicum]|uniref:Uncharacterized protein n=1 Tax=Fusarium zealandicum TaxID=1053134 RepID=A0A8H4XLQ4_9HYPO|nr:hypothetical protein FZEAL_3534 [Fusarium zealandicum]
MALSIIHIVFALVALTSSCLCLPAQQTTTAEATAQPAATLSSPTSTVSATVSISLQDLSLEERQYNASNPPPDGPRVTAAPTQEEALASLGWRQTTYYECRTRDGRERCGWHIPVMKAGAAGRGGGKVGVVAAGVVMGVMML